MFADMGLVLVLDFANVGDIGEQFVEGVASEGSPTTSISFFVTQRFVVQPRRLSCG